MLATTGMIWALSMGAATTAPRAACANELFRIGRSTNANEVVYSAQQRPDGSLDPEDPIRAEWHMLAEDGHREGLNFIEKWLAYGFSVDASKGGEGFVVVLKAKKDRPVTLTLRNGCPVASVTIAGKPAVLQKIFVQAESTGAVIPEVAWADLDGVDPASGARITERVLPE